jgi:membrane protease YdiL (CAAX protease family)
MTGRRLLPKAVERATVRSLIGKHQIAIFLVLTFVISWYPWYTGGQGFRAAGPSIAGLIVVGATSGWTGIRGMLRRFTKWRVAGIWWAAAILGPPAIILAAIGIHLLLGGDPPSFLVWKVEPLMVPIFMLILLSPMGGALGEEVFGWRGYAQSVLQMKWGRWGPLVTSLIIGVVWAVWHLPEFFNPASSQYALGLGGMAPLLVTEIANSIFMTWLFLRTGGSVLVAGIAWHLMIDTSSTMFVDLTVTGMLAGETVPPIDRGLLAVITVVMASLALLLILVTKGRLGHPSSGE